MSDALTEQELKTLSSLRGAVREAKLGVFEVNRSGQEMQARIDAMVQQAQQTMQRAAVVLMEAEKKFTSATELIAGLRGVTVEEVQKRLKSEKTDEI